MKNRKTILIIGFGSIGQRHYNNLKDQKKYNIIICTKRKDIKKYVTKTTKIKNTINDCLKENPTIALITNETSFHVPIALKLMKNNIDIFIEKPLSDSIKNILELKRIADDKKIICHTGYQFKFHPCVKKIKEIINEQRIGKVISIQVENGSYLPEWHANENYRKSYVSSKKLGGGVVLTNSHELDYLLWIFGNVKECFAITGKYSILDMKTDDLASIILKFQNNTIAEIHLDLFQRNKSRGCKIIGAEGTLIWNAITNSIKIFNPKIKKWKNVMVLRNYDYNKPYQNEIKEFLKCVETREKGTNNLDESIKVLKLALLILKSSKQKKMLNFSKNGN